MAEPTDPERQKGLELVAFRAGTQEFCVDIMCVREIRGWAPATPLPHAPPFVHGIINLRGTVLPVVDLAARLGLPATEPTSRHVIIVTELQGRIVGLLVDAVSDILTVPEDAIQPTPGVASEATRAFVRGVFAAGERMISRLALDDVLPAAARTAA
jgi:purine-binding chemotaxis protein CheW